MSHINACLCRAWTWIHINMVATSGSAPILKPEPMHFLCFDRTDASPFGFIGNVEKHSILNLNLTRQKITEIRMWNHAASVFSECSIEHHTIATIVIIHRNRMGALSSIAAQFPRKNHFYLCSFHRRLIWCSQDDFVFLFSSPMWLWHTWWWREQGPNSPTHSRNRGQHSSWPLGASG